jgi:hypothetical protein
VDRLTEVCWELAVWRRLRDELRRRRLSGVTLPEAMVLLDAKPGDPITTLLAGSLTRRTNMTSSGDPGPWVLSASGPNRTRALAKYRAIIREHVAAQQRILADQNWKREAQREELARIHQAVLNRREELRRAHHVELAEQRADLHREAFGPPRERDLPAWRAAATNAAT